MHVDEVPELLPARMLNEYTYCPRLFHLEWVQQRFEHNADTQDGVRQHRAVDRPGGKAPLPDDDDPLKRARSVQLSSHRLGLVAKLDIIEGTGADGAVRPVDVKRGTPPKVHEGAYEPERVQLCAQGLLLREAGYDCDEGVLYFAGAKRRVTIEFTPELIARTLDLLEAARLVSETDEPPPPLLDSPKCPRCSLVGICLPDEINTLADRQERPRRLLPRDKAARPLYVSQQGARISSRGGRIEVKQKDEVLASVRAIDVSQVCIYGNVQVSTQAFRALFAKEVPICFFSFGGWFSGLAQGLPAKHVELRRRQVVEAGRGGLDPARRFIVGKITNQRTILRRNARENVSKTTDQLRRLQLDADSCGSVASLLGLEGTAARLYFSRFTAMLRPEVSLPGAPFNFEGRNRRPALDPVNALLSFVYGLLTKDLTTTAHAVGFDPYLGLMHRPKFGRPALALDLAEEFRALVGDSVVLTLINNGEVTGSDFVVRAGGVQLTQAGRRAAIAAYERRLDVEITHPMFGYRVTYRRLLEVQARILAAYLLGEIDAYVPIVTR